MNPYIGISEQSLVNLGLYALSRGDLQMVMAITRILQRRRLRHV